MVLGFFVKNFGVGEVGWKIRVFLRVSGGKCSQGQSLLVCARVCTSEVKGAVIGANKVSSSLIKSIKT